MNEKLKKRNSYRNITKQEKGITLISLVITIIVLLILAGVVIATLTGDNGILTNANKGATTNAIAAAEEQIRLAVEDAMTESKIDETQGNGFYTVESKTVPALEYRLNEKLAQTELNKMAAGTANLIITGNYINNTYIFITMTYKETETKKIAITKESGNIQECQEENVIAITTKTEPTNTTISAITWENIEEIAKVISNNYGKITKSTPAVKVTTAMNGEHEIAVGDTYVIQDINKSNYTIRILGFNHDKLANTNAYGGTNIYAGISFEFVNNLISYAMNKNCNTTGGWRLSDMYKILNGDDALNGVFAGKYMTLIDASKIKTVTKRYLENYSDNNSIKTSDDKLWILARSEILGTKNMINESTMYDENDEQIRYKYYENATSSNIGKPNNSDAGCWWTRTPGSSSRFYAQYQTTWCNKFNAHDGHWATPGFSI